MYPFNSMQVYYKKKSWVFYASLLLGKESSFICRLIIRRGVKLYMQAYGKKKN